MYQDVADNPEGEFHFFHGREAETGRPMPWPEEPEAR